MAEIAEARKITLSELSVELSKAGVVDAVVDSGCAKTTSIVQKSKESSRARKAPCPPLFHG